MRLYTHHRLLALLAVGDLRLMYISSASTAGGPGIEYMVFRELKGLSFFLLVQEVKRWGKGANKFRIEITF